MNHLAKRNRRAAVNFSALACAFVMAALSSFGATVQFYMTNSLGVPDTNRIKLVPVNAFANADGSYSTRGLPFNIQPDTNGFVQTNLAAGTFLATNAFLIANYNLPGSSGTSQGVLFNVDSSTNTYRFTRYLRSGYNVYNWLTNGVTGIIGTNGFQVITNGDGTVTLDGEDFTATVFSITNGLGFLPLTPTETTNAITNGIYTATNTVFGWLGSAAFQSTNFFYRTNQNLQSGSTVLSNFVTLGTNAFYNRSDSLQTGTTTLSNFNTLGTNAFFNRADNLQTGSTVLSNFITLGTNAFYNRSDALQSGSTALSNFVTLGTNFFYPRGNPSNFVTASITNGLASTGLVASITNGLASTNLVNTKLDTNNGTAFATTLYNPLLKSAAGTNVIRISNTQLSFLDPADGLTNLWLTNGNLFFSGELNTANGNAQIDNNGDFTTVGNINAEGTLSIATGGFTVDASANISVGGSSTFTGSSEFQNDATVNGDIILPNLNPNSVLGLNGAGHVTDSTVTIAQLETYETNITARIPTTNGTAQSSLTVNGTFTGNSNAVFKTNVTAGGAFAATNLTANRVLVSDGSSPSKITNSTVSTTTLGYLDLTSSGQTQLNAKVDEDSGVITNASAYGGFSILGTLSFDMLTADKVLIIDGQNEAAASPISTNELYTLLNSPGNIATNFANRILKTNGTAQDSFTIIGTSSTRSNANFHSGYFTNAITNAGITYLTGNLFDAGTIHGNAGVISNALDVRGILTATNSMLTGPTNINSRSVGTNYVLGSISLQSTNIYTAANGDNVIDPGGSNTVVYISDSSGSPTAAYNLNGITGGRTDRWLTIVNDTTNVMTIIRESGVTAAANRIRINADTQIVTNGVVYAWYDNVISRWRIQPTPQVGSFSVTNLNSSQVNLNGSQELSIISGASVTNLHDYGTNFANYLSVTNDAVISGSASIAGNLDVDVTASFAGKISTPLTASRVAGFTSASELTNLTTTTAQMEFLRTNWTAYTTNQFLALTGGGSVSTVTNRYVQTNITTVANTMTETSLTNTGSGTLVIPANYLQAGNIIRLTAMGFISSDAGGQSATFRVKLGATTMCAGALAEMEGANTNHWSINALMTVQTNGATAGIVAGGTLSALNFSSGASVGIGSLTHLVKTNSTTIDTTAALVPNLTVEWGSASAQNSATCQQFFYEVLKP